MAGDLMNEQHLTSAQRKAIMLAIRAMDNAQDVISMTNETLTNVAKSFGVKEPSITKDLVRAYDSLEDAISNLFLLGPKNENSMRHG